MNRVALPVAILGGPLCRRLCPAAGQDHIAQLATAGTLRPPHLTLDGLSEGLNA